MIVGRQVHNSENQVLQALHSKINEAKSENREASSGREEIMPSLINAMYQQLVKAPHYNNTILPIIASAVLS